MSKSQEVSHEALPRSRGAEIVHRLFEHLEVPRRERTRRLEELMGWTYHPAHRRLTGEIPWTVDELERLAEACGMTLASALQLDRQQDGEPAVFLLGGSQIPCRVWLRDPRDPPRSSPLAAVRSGERWIVTSRADTAPSLAREVIRAVLEPEPDGPRFRIAVVDDSSEVCEGLCAYLRLSGFDAQPFSNFEDLKAGALANPFDGYVLDWLVGASTAAGSIAEIRSRDSRCPIVVLTGKIRDGQVDEDQVAMVVTVYRALFFEKPAATAIIAAQLKQALESPPIETVPAALSAIQ